MEPKTMDFPISQQSTSSLSPETTARPRAALAPHRVNAVTAYIDEHLAESVGVRRLAQVVNMSPFHFARMFKGALGVPPHAYITNARMERAKRLLATSELPLREVATTVGYQTQAHFTGVFHKHVGVTPRTYRLSARGENLPSASAIPVRVAAEGARPEAMSPA
jgi:AraC-like DNA-binding protein